MVIFWNFAGVPFVRLLCMLHCFPRWSSLISPISTLWCTWLLMTHPHIDSPFRRISSCTLPFSPLTICQCPWTAVITFWLTISVTLSWDTSMAQKSRFKMQTQGITKFRKTFPQLPGCVVKNPTYIQTAHGYADPSTSRSSWHEHFA